METLDLTSLRLGVDEMGACGGAGCPVLGSSKEEVTDERCSGSDYAALPSVCSSLTPDRSLTLAELVDGISAVLHASKQKPLDTLLCLGQMLRAFDLSGKEWERYRLFDDKKNYTRNLIATDDETFTLILLCWNPGRFSPIHDHPCDGCWVRVMEGSIQEVRYGSTPGEDGSLPVTADATLTDGEVTFMHDSMGFHKVGNPGTGPACSLHLYSPPYSSCRVWMDASRPTEVLQPIVTYFSEYGEIVERKGQFT